MLKSTLALLKRAVNVHLSEIIFSCSQIILLLLSGVVLQLVAFLISNSTNISSEFSILLIEICFVFGLFGFLVLVIFLVTNDYDTKAIKYIPLFGVSRFDYYLALALEYTLVYAFFIAWVHFVLCMMTFYGNISYMVSLSEYFYHTTFLACTVLCNSAYASLISLVSDNTSVILMIQTAWFFLGTIKFLFFGEGENYMKSYFFTPSSAMMCSLRKLSEYSNVELTLTRPCSTPSSFMISMQLVETLICLIVYAYLQIVMPNRFALSKPWNFLFEFRKKTKRSISSESLSNPNLFKCQLEDNNFIMMNDSSVTNEYTLIVNSLYKNFDEGLYLKQRLKLWFYRILRTNVTACIKGVNVLRGISFAVKRNQIVGFLGSNKSGITTLFSIICGFYDKTYGQVIINKRCLSGKTTDLLKNVGFSRAQILSIFSSSETFFGVLKFTQYVKCNALDMNEINEICKTLNCQRIMDIKIKNLTQNQLALLQIAVAFVGKPDIVVLDDLFDGLFYEDIESVANLLRSKRSKCSILFSTNDIDKAFRFSDIIALLHQGQLSTYASPSYLNRMFSENYLLAISCERTSMPSIVDEITNGELKLRLILQNELSVSFVVEAEKLHIVPQYIDELIIHKKHLNIKSIKLSNTVLVAVLRRKLLKDTSLIELNPDIYAGNKYYNRDANKNKKRKITRAINKSRNFFKNERKDTNFDETVLTKCTDKAHNSTLSRYLNVDSLECNDKNHSLFNKFRNSGTNIARKISAKFLKNNGLASGTVRHSSLFDDSLSDISAISSDDWSEASSISAVEYINEPLVKSERGILTEFKLKLIMELNERWLEAKAKQYKFRTLFRALVWQRFHVLKNQKALFYVYVLFPVVACLMFLLVVFATSNDLTNPFKSEYWVRSFEMSSFTRGTPISLTSIVDKPLLSKIGFEINVFYGLFVHMTIACFLLYSLNFISVQSIIERKSQIKKQLLFHGLPVFLYWSFEFLWQAIFYLLEVCTIAIICYLVTDISILNNYIFHVLLLSVLQSIGSTCFLHLLNRLTGNWNICHFLNLILTITCPLISITRLVYLELYELDSFDTSLTRLRSESLNAHEDCSVLSVSCLYKQKTAAGETLTLLDYSLFSMFLILFMTIPHVLYSYSLLRVMFYKILIDVNEKLHFLSPATTINTTTPYRFYSKMYVIQVVVGFVYLSVIILVDSFFTNKYPRVRSSLNNEVQNKIDKLRHHTGILEQQGTAATNNLAGEGVLVELQKTTSAYTPKRISILDEPSIGTCSVTDKDISVNALDPDTGSSSNSQVLHTTSSNSMSDSIDDGRCFGNQYFNDNALDNSDSNDGITQQSHSHMLIPLYPHKNTIDLDDALDISKIDNEVENVKKRADRVDVFINEWVNVGRNEKMVYDTVTGAFDSEVPILQVEGLCSQPVQECFELANISFSLFEKNVIAITSKEYAASDVLLKIVGGLLSPARGKIYYLSRDVTNRALYRWRLIRQTTPVVMITNQCLSPANIIELFARLNGVYADKFSQSFVHHCLDLINVRDTSVVEFNRYTRSDLKKISLILAMVCGRRVIIVDNPTDGLDEFNKTMIWKILQLLNMNYKIGIIINTTDVSEAFDLADEVLVLKKRGKVQYYNKKNSENKENLFYVVTILLRDRCDFDLSSASQLCMTHRKSFITESRRNSIGGIPRALSVIPLNKNGVARNRFSLPAHFASISQENNFGSDILMVNSTAMNDLCDLSVDSLAVSSENKDIIKVKHPSSAFRLTPSRHKLKTRQSHLNHSTVCGKSDPICSIIEKVSRKIARRFSCTCKMKLMFNNYGKIYIFSTTDGVNLRNLSDVLRNMSKIYNFDWSAELNTNYTMRNYLLNN